MRDYADVYVYVVIKPRDYWAARFEPKSETMQNRENHVKRGMIFRVGIIESRKPREKGHDFQYRYGLDTLCEYRVCVCDSRGVCMHATYTRFSRPLSEFHAEF